MFKLIEIELIRVSTIGARASPRKQASREEVTHARARNIRQKVAKEEGETRK